MKAAVPPNPPDIVTELLALPNRERQAAYLAERNRLDEDGLADLLQQAAALTRRDPGQAAALAALCAEFAPGANAPALVPQADYVQAQAWAIQGEFARSLDLIEQAHGRYLALGEPLRAQRTHLGRMHVLNEMGQHQAAAELGQQVLDWLEANSDYAGPETKLMRVLAHINRGVCRRRMGQYEAALADYETAETLCLDAGLTDRLGDLRNNRGIILLHLGRVSDALAALTGAAQARAAAGQTLLYAETMINVGEAHLAAGQYAQSLAALQEADDLLQTVAAPTSRRYVRLHQADVYLALNLFPEALAAYTEAETAFRQAGMNHYLARALWGMGAVLARQMQPDAAAARLAQAAALFRAAENGPMWAGVLLEQAALQAETDPVQAQETAQQALQLLTAQQRPVQQVYAYLRLADLASAGKRLQEAAAHLDAVQELLTGLALPHLQYRLQQRLGRLHREQGHLAEARRRLETAVSTIEDLRGHVAHETMRTSFLRDKINAYDELLRLHLQAGDADAAFATAERARARSLLDLLGGVDAEPAAAETAVPSRLDTLQADLNALYNEFLSPERPHDAAQQQARMQKIEQEIRRLRLQSLADAPADPFAAPLPWPAIRLRLPPDLTLLAYYVLDGEILAFLSRDDAPVQIVRRVADLNAVQRLLQRLLMQWDHFRVGPAFVQRHQTRLLQSAQRVLQELHAVLIRPLLPHLPTMHPAPLAIVPHGPLHQVPFHALYDGERYLIDDFVLSYAPGASVLALTPPQPTPSPPRALVTAVPDPLIPAVAQEAAWVAQELPGAVQHSGAAATRAVLPDATRGVTLWHIACHGLFRHDNPMFSALKLHDGWLDAAQISQLDLRDALVTLSACESGRSEVWAGDEVIGLTRAFLGAGAATLVASLWVVQDDTTALLMRNWYRNLRRQQFRRPAAALRAAQLSLRVHHPHPYYWAPFTLIGRR